MTTESKRLIQLYDEYIKDFMQKLGEMTYPQRLAAEAGIITLTLFLEKMLTQKPLVEIHDKYHLTFDKLLGEKWKI